MFTKSGREITGYSLKFYLFEFRCLIPISVRGHRDDADSYAPRPRIAPAADRREGRE